MFIQKSHNLLTLKPGVYDFRLSAKHNRSYSKTYPGFSKLYNGSE